ncbi:hypothetical protein [Leifsonia sp. RAF41]|uniref:hypothetical protein n=1 Tax=Leifsonia sp. RAF41 TaxID=3233056 RepID=UPI003F9526BA
MSDVRRGWSALRTGALAAPALAAAIVVAALLPGTGSYALWNGATTTDAGTVTAATVSVTETMAPYLDVAFRSGRTSATGGVLVTNTSSVTASVTTVATLGPGSSAPLAAAIAVLAWPTASTASCTASAVVPPTAYSATWASAAGVPLTGTLGPAALGPGASTGYCVRTTMNVASASGIASGSAIDIAMTTTVSAGSTWSSTATTGARQSFADDLAPSAPTALTASATAGSSDGVGLSWAAATDNVGVVGYDVYRSGAAAPIGSTSSTTFTDDGAAADTEYTYSVVARDAVGLTSPAATLVVGPTAAAPASSPAPVTP